MNRWKKLCNLGFGCALACLATAQSPNLTSGLVWRNIGPFRGGRVSAVSGVVGRSGVFYIGLPLGGLWKTTGAGTTWHPILDSIKDASSVGAVEVAPSDPNVIYVGMGDMVTGGGINEGNGVYKSADAGKTWKHIGLDETKQIPSILVDPNDPNLVMVAAQGNLHVKSSSRGLYRSTDGGRTWTKTLYVDDQTGVQKIAWAFDNPSVMLATTVRHYSAPGVFGRPGGPPGPGGPNQAPSANGPGLYKSTDEGLTWKRVSGGGVPNIVGRTCVAIAMNTHSQRMFLVGNSGLYRSDDGGKNWRRMDAADRRVANGQGGYNCGVYVSSKDPDTVYVINTSSYISHDGGNTFTGFKGAPGGDDPQQMWIDPTDSKRMLLGTDQGATVSLDGGRTWSSWYNQATAQVYHISVDNSFPYWVYATQQDSGAIATRSRGNLGEITPLDWQPTPGYEFGSIVADPLNPNIVYSGGPGGGIVKITYPSGQWINVSPNMDGALALRKVGNQPLAWSQSNPHELLAGFQYLMATTDGGHRWHMLSGDLGHSKAEMAALKAAAKKPAPKPAAAKTPPPKPTGATPTGGGNIQEPDVIEPGTEDSNPDDPNPDDPDRQEGQRGGPGPGSIESFSTSSVDRGVIWVGTNNGLIKITKDHGRTWDDVTIPNLPNPTRADVSAIDASHQDPAVAYVAVDFHNMTDYAPYFFRTRDYGKTWTKIVNGLPTDQPSGSFARVIRADTKKPGLIFAGTESSVYVSLDDGDVWQPLGDLPNTSYRDMVIKDNDLVVGTYGRGFWILDDISPLRQLNRESARDSVHLFEPGEAIRIRRNTNGDTPFPPEVPHAPNPPLGAILYYSLPQTPVGAVNLDITDSNGMLVRHMSSAALPAVTDPPAPVPDFWLEKPMPMPTNPGLNRVNWNLRYDSPPAFSHSYEINANPGETPPSPEGPLVLPGVYTATLTVDGVQYKQMVRVRNDPRSPASASDLRAQHELQLRAVEGAKIAWDGFHRVAAMRAAVAAAGRHNSDAELDTAITDFEAKLAAVGGTIGFGRGFGGFRRGGPPPPPTFARVNGIMSSELNSLDSGDMRPSGATGRSAQANWKQLQAVVTSWNTLNAKDLVTFNKVLAKHNIQPIAASSSMIVNPKV